MRIYDQVSLRDHVKSDCFERRNEPAYFAIGSSILLSPGAKLKQFFRGIQQRKRQYQLRIPTTKSTADFLKLSIYKGFNRLYSRFGSRAPNRKFTAKNCHGMACFHSMTLTVF